MKATARLASIIGTITGAFAIIGATIITGCGPVLAPQPDPSRYYLLSPAYAPPPSGVSSQAALTIGLGPIQMPGYLDRREIATRANTNQIDYSNVDRWSEPLDSNFRSVLASNLAAELGSVHIVDFPWFQNKDPDYAIAIDVNRFERGPNGTADLSAHWTIRDPAAKTILLQGDCLATTPAQGADAASSVAALSTDLGQLSSQLATAIRQLQQAPRQPAPSAAS
jgi:uncharacterized lipoprotein YmbA